MHLNDTPALRSLLYALDATLEAATHEIETLGPACPLAGPVMGKIFELRADVSAVLEETP